MHSIEPVPSEPIPRVELLLWLSNILSLAISGAKSLSIMLGWKGPPVNLVGFGTAICAGLAL